MTKGRIGIGATPNAQDRLQATPERDEERRRIADDVVDHSSNDQSRKRPVDQAKQRRLDQVRREVGP
jgi:hypothetical protein